MTVVAELSFLTIVRIIMLMAAVTIALGFLALLIGLMAGLAAGFLVRTAEGELGFLVMIELGLQPTVCVMAFLALLATIRSSRTTRTTDTTRDPVPGRAPPTKSARFVKPVQPTSSRIMTAPCHAFSIRQLAGPLRDGTCRIADGPASPGCRAAQPRSQATG